MKPVGRPAAEVTALSVGRGILGRESRRVAKYGIVGVSNVAIDFAVYALLVSLGVWYPAAKVMAFVVATINGYTFNRTWTFRAGAHRAVVLTKYVTVQVSCLVANLVLLVLLVELAGVDQLLAQAVVLPAVALTGFLGQRLWTFGHTFR